MLLNFLKVVCNIILKYLFYNLKLIKILKNIFFTKHVNKNDVIAHVTVYMYFIKIIKNDIFFKNN